MVNLMSVGSPATNDNERHFDGFSLSPMEVDHFWISLMSH
jgi:hypothetical protein